MEIHRIKISNYKQFQNFELEFNKTDLEQTPLSLKFLIGENGSGKSSLIEAIGLIFTRAMHDESPGFIYEIIYSIFDKVGKQTYVYLTNSPNRKLTGRVQVRTHSQKSRVEKAKIREYKFSEQTELHPTRIFSFASGPNNELEDVLVWSPLKSLHSDLYDKKQDSSGQDVEISNLERLYKRFLFEPFCLNFDVKSAACILIALFGSLPREEERNDYLKKRKALLKNVPDLNPVGISFTVDERKIEILKSSKVEEGNTPLFIKEFNYILELGKDYSHYSLEHNNKGTEAKVYRKFYFPISLEENNERDTITIGKESESSPLQLLTTFMVALRAGYLKEAHIQFAHRGSAHLIDESDLSDGEWLWLCRMGLILLTQTSSVNNMLFLFDEPDVFLNEKWITDFIFDLHKYSEITKFNGEEYERSYMNHEYFIATHSTLMLTDALPTQTYIFQKKNLNEKETELLVHPIKISTFAADRAEISARLFTNYQRTGAYSHNKINKAIENKDLKQVEFLLTQAGPGYDRFRLEDVHISIKPSTKD